MVKKFDKFNITQVPRDQNEEADQLARIATEQEHLVPSGVSYQVHDQPSTKLEKIQVCVMDYSNSWPDPIVQYLQHGTVPNDRNEARKLRIRAARYTLIEEVLYMRSFTLPYLRCLIPSQATYAMNEVHEGICGAHHSARTLSYKLMRLGYY